METAVGSFFYLISQEQELSKLYIDNAKQLQIDLYSAILTLLRVDAEYYYYPDSLVPAVRIYIGYFNKDWFGQYYLNSKYAACQSTWRRSWNRSRHFQASPRDHGKSWVFSYELPIWKICYVDNIRILMSSKSDKLADKYLGAIKRTIETNQKILEDFGDLTENINPVDGSLLEGGKGKGGWSSHVLFCRRSNHALKDGTIESIGWGSGVTGSRFDLIVLDDPIEEKDCNTKKSREKQKESLHVLEELLEPEGGFLVIGTRKHYADVYSYIIDNPRWSYTIDKGIIKFPEKYDYIMEIDSVSGKNIATGVCVPDGETYEVLWKEKWSIQALLLKKYGTLPLHFLREIQNEVSSDETSDFPKDIIEENVDIVQLGRRVPFESSRPNWAKWVVIGVDLSGVFNKKKAEENDNDYTVIEVIAVDDNGNRHLINAYHERGVSPTKQLNKMVEFHYDFQSDIIVLEVNAYQKAMESMALDKTLPMYPHNTGSEKHGIEHGLPRMAIELKNKFFIFYTGCTESKQFYSILFDELHGYGVETHDDTVMCLWLVNLGIGWLMQKEQYRERRKKKRINKRSKQIAEKIKSEITVDDVNEIELSNGADDKQEEARKLLEESLRSYED